MGVYKRESNGRYYFDEFVDGVRVEKSLRTSDRKVAEREASKLRDRKKAQARGEMNFDETLEATVPTLVTEYVAELRRRGRAPRHVDTTEKRINRLLAGMVKLSEATPERIRHALARVTQEGTTRENFPGKLPEGPLSAKTANDYRVCLSGFFTWLVKEGRWAYNPLVHVARARVTGATFERRALTRDELGRLLEKAPPLRSAIYRLMATSGLRRGEVRALRWADLVPGTKIIRVRAETAKNRHEAHQPVPKSTLDAILALRGDAQATAPVFAALPLTRTFYADLAKAEIKVDPAEGRVDVHALRVTYCTLLARAGVSLVQAQKLMRHSDPKLTANVYSRLGLVDGHEAVAKLAMGDEEVADRLDEVADLALATLATGTEGASGTASGTSGTSPGLSPEVRDANMRKLAVTTTPKVRQNEKAPLRRARRGLGSRSSAGLGLEPRHAGSEPERQPSIGPEIGNRLPGLPPEVEHGNARKPADLARDLLAAAVSAPDPRPLIEAAQALLRQEDEARAILRLPDARQA